MPEDFIELMTDAVSCFDDGRGAGAPGRGAGEEESEDASEESGASEGWTQQELIESAQISSKTFDTIRKSARVKGPSHGGLSWVFSAEEVILLVKKAEGGRFTERGGPAGKAWRALLLERGIRIESDEPPKRRRW